MVHQERIGNLMALGYTAREAEFLCRAALHSGYFVRRQFLSFTDRYRGKLDSALAEKALGVGHVKELIFRHKRTVYSFCSKPFFQALGDTDNRNRRTHEVSTIKSRLIGLDFVLSHPNYQYLATEAEKVAYFHDQLGIPLERLPSKKYRAKDSEASTERCFIDKFPIGIESQFEGQGPIVLFCYVDEGTHSTSGFESYLEQYRWLFAQLNSFRLVYASVIGEHFEQAQRLFERRILGQNGGQLVESHVNRLLQYFSDRDAYERKDLVRFDQRKLIQFREDRSEFSGSRNDQLFECWKRGGDAEVVRRLCPAGSEYGAGHGRFETWRSAFRYELFGTLTCGDEKRL